LVSGVGYETRNYKYFAGICRGFLRLSKEKSFKQEHYLKNVEFFNGMQAAIDLSRDCFPRFRIESQTEI